MPGYGGGVVVGAGVGWDVSAAVSAGLRRRVPARLSVGARSGRAWVPRLGPAVTVVSGAGVGSVPSSRGSAIVPVGAAHGQRRCQRTLVSLDDLEPGRTSWTALLNAARLGPADDVTAVTAEQLRAVLTRLVTAGQWQPGDPNILIVTDAGYDVTRLAFVLDDLPVELVGRIRCDRVLRLPKPPGTTGRPPKHGPEIALNKPTTWPQPQHTTNTDTSRYGTATATSWDRVHPRLTHRGCWIDHHGELPVIEGTLIRLQVEHLPGDRNPKPVWLWSSITGATTDDVDRWWQAFLRRFDLEHTFRLLKQTLGCTRPKLRAPQAADR